MTCIDVHTYMSTCLITNSAAATIASAPVVTTMLKSEPIEPQTSEVPKEDTQTEVKEQSEETAVVTSATLTVLDNAEKEQLSEEIVSLQGEIQKNKAEVIKYKEELEKEKERILTLEEEISHLSKEKTRFEKQATENKQVCKNREKNCLLVYQYNIFKCPIIIRSQLYFKYLFV